MKLDRLNLVLIFAFTASLATLVYLNTKPQKTPTVQQTQELDQQRLLQTVKQQNADLIVVNFWASWCDPCVKEIPQLIRLQKKFDESNVKLLFVSMDEEDQVSEMLTMVHKNPEMLNFRKSEPGAKIIVDIFPKWQGVIPLTMFFSRQGELLQSVEGVRNDQDFEKIIQQLIQH